QAQATVPPQTERQYEELPQEVIDAFADGMTVDEFLAQNKGPIPMALWDLTDQKIAVVIEMESPALISRMLADSKTPSATQRSYVAEALRAQEPLAAKVAAVGGSVISQYTKVYNGVLALVPANELKGLRSVAGVKAIHYAPQYEPTLATSIPLIQADDVWQALPVGYDGAGVDVAVIDTGIDYTHAAFGGIGTPLAYANNDPSVIEEGSFPTAKVIGGYDFAGTNYDAGGDTDEQLIPVPDDDPLDEGGHGTHVASTAAGMGVPDVIGKGVAPSANLYAFKVFGAAGSTNLVVDALEMAMDPNGDGDLSDRVDVINMSLGSVWGVADDSDPEQVAIDLISQMGTVVVVSAGNEGNSTYVTGSPAVSDAAISVAASSKAGFVDVPTIKYGDPVMEAPYMPAISFPGTVSATLIDVDTVDGTSGGTLCTVSGVSAESLTGNIALIQRGDCTFEAKINNAATLHAIGVIIYSRSTDLNEFIPMGVGNATLPAGHTQYNYGIALKAANGKSVTVGPDSETNVYPSGENDRVATFSSRGPRGYDSKLKPEITAPGVAIFAAAMGSGAEGVSMDGTSMAAPHVTGVAALMKEAHPDWSVEQIKAAMMSTADDLNAADANGYRVVPRTGAGRVNAFDAVFTPTIATGDADLVSLSWGMIEYGDQTANYLVPEIKQVRIQNLDSVDRTFDVSAVFTDNMPDAGATLEIPATVTVTAGSTGWIPVSLTLHPNELSFGDLEEYYGFVVFTPQDGAAAVRVPFYFVPRPYNTLSNFAGDSTIAAMSGVPALKSFDVSGSTASSLWGWTLVGIDPNESTVLDRADLQAVGMDYGGSSSKGKILSVAFANWGGVHTPQPYYSETDLVMDYNQDGEADYLFFNYNEGGAYGLDEDNNWMVIQIDLASGMTYLGSPYYIYADFNSGLVEWYLPDAYAGFNDGDSRLNYAVSTSDGTGAW
ncbi:hypothetical protein FDZ74_01715, partial [bacterium]